MTTTTNTLIATIKERVASDPRWAERALVVLLAFQTEDEQATQETHHLNGCGFNGTDAAILTSFAQQVDRRHAAGRAYGTILSDKQLGIAYKKLPKYARQLAAASEAKGGAA